MTSIIEQTPTERIDWTIDWSKRGLGTDAIQSSEWEASSDEFTLEDASYTGTTTTIFVTGGIPGKTYTVTNRVHTAGGRDLEETVPYVCIPQRLISG